MTTILSQKQSDNDIVSRNCSCHHLFNPILPFVSKMFFETRIRKKSSSIITTLSRYVIGVCLRRHSLQIVERMIFTHSVKSKWISLWNTNAIFLFQLCSTNQPLRMPTLDDGKYVFKLIITTYIWQHMAMKRQRSEGWLTLPKPYLVDFHHSPSQILTLPTVNIAVNKIDI